MKLKELRIENGLNQKEIAEILNLERVTYHQYENGKRQADITTLCKIADYYNVTLDYLCDHENKSFFDFGPLTENQKKIIINTTKLDKENQILALVYTQGLLDTQSIGV